MSDWRMLGEKSNSARLVLDKQTIFRLRISVLQTFEILFPCSNFPSYPQRGSKSQRVQKSRSQHEPLTFRLFDPFTPVVPAMPGQVSQPVREQFWNLDYLYRNCLRINLVDKITCFVSKMSRRFVRNNSEKTFASGSIIVIYIILNCLFVLQAWILDGICLNPPEVFLILKNRSNSWLSAAKRNNCISLIPVACFVAGQKCFNQGSTANGPQRRLTEIARTFDQQARCVTHKTRRGAESFVPCQWIRIGRRG